MKQIYYVIQTLLRGRGSNIIKIISLGLSLTISCFSPALHTSRALIPATKTMTTFTKSGLYLPSKAKSIRHKNRTVVLWQAPYWRIFRNRGKLPPALATGKILPCTMATFVLMKKRLWQTRSFFRQWVSRC